MKTRGKPASNKGGDPTSTPKKQASSKASTRSTPSRSAKARNKVVSAVPRRSPELVAPRTTRQTTAAAGDDLSSEGTEGSTASRPGLGHHICKQLAKDIEEAGGIATFIKKPEERNKKLIAELCDDKQDVYGPRQDKRREQVRKKVWHWIRLHEQDKYTERVLNRYEVKSAAERKREERRKKRSEAKKKAGGESSSSSSSSSASDDSSDGSASKSSGSSIESVPESLSAKLVASKKQKTAAPVPVVICSQPSSAKRSSTKPTKKPAPKPHPLNTEAVSQPVTQPEPSNMPGSPSSRLSLPHGYTRIAVNIDCPEANGPVYVFREKDLDSVKSDDDQWPGFLVMWRFDYRYLADESDYPWLKARVFNHHSILLSVPSFDYTLLHVNEGFKEKLPANANRAVVNGRSHYLNNEAARRIKHYLLEFPVEVELSSSEVFLEAGEDEKLKIVSKSIKWEHKKMPGVEGYEYWSWFEVADVSGTPFKKGRTEDVAKNKSDVAKYAEDDFAGLSLDSLPRRRVSPQPQPTVRPRPPAPPPQPQPKVPPRPPVPPPIRAQQPIPPPPPLPEEVPLPQSPGDSAASSSLQAQASLEASRSAAAASAAERTARAAEAQQQAYGGFMSQLDNVVEEGSRDVAEGRNMLDELNRGGVDGTGDASMQDPSGLLSKRTKEEAASTDEPGLKTRLRKRGAGRGL